MARPHIEPYVELNNAYKEFNLPGFSGGSHYKVLSLDIDSGASTLKMQFDGGYSRKPGMSYSDMELFVLKGEMQIGDKTIVEGHYMFIPAGMAMGAINVPNGCETLIFYNDGEPTFIETDQNHPLTMTEAFVSLNAYEDAPWAPGNVVQPSVASGCLLKLLRYDPYTEAMTFMYCMTPEFMQDNISYHDCAEESYHIWGESWMMQFGNLPTGGYFWRPPYINHGSFRCKLGTIAIGRTDSKLHNYFHYNPWTNPDENKLRAAAMMYRQRPELYKWTAAHGHNHPHGPQDFEYKDYHMDPQVRHLHGYRDDPHHYEGERHPNNSEISTPPVGGVDSKHHHHHHHHDHDHDHGHGHHHHHHHDHD